MEDGDISEMEVSAPINTDDNNVLQNKMANYPDVEVTVIKNKSTTDCKTNDSPAKINGESDRVHSDEQEEYTSDEDALIIDEECRRVENKSGANHKRVRSPSPRANFKGFKKRIIAKSIHFLKITNELRKIYQLDEKDKLSKEVKINLNEETCIQGELNTKDPVRNDSDIKTGTLTNQKPLNDANIHLESPKHKQATCPSLKSSAKKPVKKRPSQKLTEYAQYLGLQPAVKFKCVKCSESSFPSLSALNEHQRQCLVQPASTKPAPAPAPSHAAPAPASTNFRVTRKVFLCSSCGTYYENCNLFLHMREVHRRYICLYCLGMFSLPEKLSHHLVTKHNCSPNHYSSAEDFLSSYSESCFLVCCHCERVFSERDNFFHHVCLEKRGAEPEKSCWSCAVKGTSAHLYTCKANIEQPPSTSTLSQKPTSTTTTTTSKLFNQKSQKLLKSSKNHLKTAPPTHIEHITADSPSTSLIAPEIENEEVNAAEHFMADVISCLNPEPEIPDKVMSVQNTSPCPVENKDLNENSTHSLPEPEESITEKNNTEQISNEVVKPIEDTENNDIKETVNTHEGEEENLNKPSNSEQLEERKSDNEESALPEENSESINGNISGAEENISGVEENISGAEENMSGVEENISGAEETISVAEEKKFEQENAQNDVEALKHTEGEDKTNALETMSENKDVHQNSENSPDELDSTNNEDEEDDKPKDNCKSDTENKSPKSETNIVVEETRKVPKVTLKLPPQGLIYSENESEDSEKLTMEVDENSHSDIDCEESQDNSKLPNESEEKPVNGIDENDKENSDHNDSDDDSFQVAGEDVSIVELELEQPLDKFSIETLLKTCLTATIPMCVYCNHARKIAVNGKQLGMHAIAEHRFAATVNSITAEELIPKNFVARIKESLDEIESLYFSLEEKEKSEQEIKDDALPVTTFKRVYECFQCRYATTIHKELYLHNRKMHAKTILLCIMCKSNFYSYSELICHLCPGNYVLNSETKFRCCMCESNDLPSAFRLMVHLRKRHHTCDVCLEGCHNQSKLSNHVWKHKLHHLCYRCGIAYRNKPDITKHLFWKHGTESVLCKKCLQKKWPHVYHFCIPPVSFVCEECNLIFSKAVYLKVHKRLHSNEKPHACTEENCTQTFISKKLQLKHEMKHREPIPIVNLDPEDDNKENINVKDENDKDAESTVKKESVDSVKHENDEKNPALPEKEEVKTKSLIDVYDLPALNLSESDSDDSDDDKTKSAPATQQDEKIKVEVKNENLPIIESVAGVTSMEEDQKPVPILDGIWDNFKNYQATIEKRDILTGDIITKDPSSIDKIDGETELVEETNVPDIDVILADHDYCIVYPAGGDSLEMEIDEGEVAKNNGTTGLDHDYCTVSKTETNPNQPNRSNLNEGRTATPETVDKKKNKASKKKTPKHAGSSSSSSSDSDSGSSSCTCGPNCSCSSSSGSSSSSSTSSDSDSSSSEGKRRILARRERRKERAKRKKESETSHAASNTSAVDVVATEDHLVSIQSIELPILETDLDTDETETDEDFYDEHPQRLANKILAEKRNQLALLAAVAPVSNGTILECSRPSTPSIPEEVATQKKKVKSKKRKKKSRSSPPKQEIRQPNIPVYNHQSPITIPPPSLPRSPAISSPLSIIHPIPPPHVPPDKKKHHRPPRSAPGSGSETDSNVRASKRRRVPNKFYGYSSDEESADRPTVAPVFKWRKSDLPASSAGHATPPQLVPPLTIKNIPSPAPVVEPVRAPVIHHQPVESDSDVEEVRQKSSSDSSDSNRNDDSDSDTGQLHISQPHAPPHFAPHLPTMPPHVTGERSNENLYCYCQCPYDEVSEMIACDGKDCAIEWFHFECVGIMVPPKGKWFCPDCRKRASMSRGDFVQT